MAAASSSDPRLFYNSDDDGDHCPFREHTATASALSSPSSSTTAAARRSTLLHSVLAAQREFDADLMPDLRVSKPVTTTTTTTTTSKPGAILRS
jgi:hypothetical protein